MNEVVVTNLDDDEDGMKISEDDKKDQDKCQNTKTISTTRAPKENDLLDKINKKFPGYDHVLTDNKATNSRPNDVVRIDGGQASHRSNVSRTTPRQKPNKNQKGFSHEEKDMVIDDIEDY